MATLFDDASLVMIPSGYKDDKLYSIKPTSGDGDFTFSRDGSGASPATRVNSAGLIEKGRTNELLQSNSFDTTWTNNNSTETEGQSGYDGTNDAWLLNSVGSGSAYVAQSVSSSGVKTLSVYAKAGTADWVIVQMAGGTASYAWFDLSSGAVGTSVQLINSEITSVGGGWYRCSITGTNSNTSVNIYISNADNSTSTSSGDNIYIQDAQLEKGLVATSYIETTTAAASAGILGDMPRLDYSGGASCPSLLLEPARTNQIIQSEYFGASTWLKRTSDATAVPVVTDNYAVSPEGVQNAARVVITKPSGDSQYTVINENKVITKSVGDKFSASVYLKATDATQVGKVVDLYAYDGSYMTMVNHTLTTDWERVEAIHTATTGTSNVEMVTIGKARASAGGTTLANMATDFLVYGATFEAGSYPTSYVPTYGSATARAADSCSVTGVSDVIGQTEGTLFLDYETENAEDNGRLIAIGDGSTNNRILLRNQGSGTLLYVAAGGSSTWSTTYYVPGNTGRIKIGLGYANNDGILFVNGSSVNNDTSVSVPACSNVYIGTSEYGGAEDTNIKVNQALLFKTRLTNSELESLTTL